MSPVISRSSASGILSVVRGDVVAEQPRPLEAAMQRVAAGAGVVFAGDAARLDRLAVTRLMTRRCSTTCAARGEGGIHLGLVAGLVEIGLVVRAIVVELRRARCEGVARRYDRGPRRIVDRDTLGGVARLVERVGDHHRDRIADMHHAVDARSPAACGRYIALPSRVL